MRAEIEIRTAAVDESGARLGAGAGETFRIEQEAARSGQQERREMFQRHPEDIGRRSFGRMSVNSHPAIALRVCCKRIIDLNAVVLVEEITVARKHASAIGGC